MKDFLLAKEHSRRFVYILERSREISDYAKNETAKLNAEFYDYLCEYQYMLVSVCRESTSYKKYLQMSREGFFRFFYNFGPTESYYGSHEPFYFIVGEFFNKI